MIHTLNWPLINPLPYPYHPFSFFKSPISIFCELIPEILFMFCLFGYLAITIFYKWIVFDANDASTAPSLLISKLSPFTEKSI